MAQSAARLLTAVAIIVLVTAQSYPYDYNSGYRDGYKRGPGYGCSGGTADPLGDYCRGRSAGSIDSSVDEQNQWEAWRKHEPEPIPYGSMHGMTPPPIGLPDYDRPPLPSDR
jgi:hypothetical protein